MKSNYQTLGILTLIHIGVMYVLMFSMINRGQYFYNNINMLYMAIVMAAPITLVMLFSMGGMYNNKKLNFALYAFFAFLFAASFYAIRVQAAVDDKQFLRSMIPHHSGAILMCREGKITDPEIKALCQGIIESQQREINQMQDILKRY